MSLLKHILSLSAMSLMVTSGAIAAGLDQTVNHIIANWRWTYYWFGETGVENYVEGKRISVLVFRNTSVTVPSRGLCSADLVTCSTYAGAFLDPLPVRVHLSQSVSMEQAFDAFVRSGFRDQQHPAGLGTFSAADFDVRADVLVLPGLGIPARVSSKPTAQQRRQAESIRSVFQCWGTGRPPAGCKGTLVFARLGTLDPYWFVLRSCSNSCAFSGDSVEMLRRGDFENWEVTAAGLIDRPAADVTRFREKIIEAQWFRLDL
jgi:hypothetical protein